MAENQLVEYRTKEFENSEVMLINEIPEYTTEDYDLFNEKDFKKYIDDIERMVRSSKEYSDCVCTNLCSVFDSGINPTYKK